MVSEHSTGHRVILRIGQGHNKTYVTIPNYIGPLTVGPNLIGALITELDRRHHECGWKTFDLIEIVGTEDS